MRRLCRLFDARVNHILRTICVECVGYSTRKGDLEAALCHESVKKSDFYRRGAETQRNASLFSNLCASAMETDVPKAPWTAAARRRLEMMPLSSSAT